MLMRASGMRRVQEWLMIMRISKRRQRWLNSTLANRSLTASSAIGHHDCQRRINSLSVSSEHIKRCEAEIDARQEKAREKGLRALAAQRQLMHVQNQAQQQAAFCREAAMSGNSSASQFARPSNAPTPSVP
jgi:hypothetical protein